MASRTFVAFSSEDSIVADTIVAACEAAQCPDTSLEPWNRNDSSGYPIDQSVYSWVDSADSFVADISVPNHNVTYEIGLAIGMSKPVRFIRANNKDIKDLESIGLFHNVAHNDFDGRDTLIQILEKSVPVAPWRQARRNREQPVYFLQLAVLNDCLRRVASNIKKTLKVKFRNFNPQEIDRLTATEAFEQVSQSFGVIAVWEDSKTPEAFRQNQRAAFTIGLARGLDIPFLLFAHENNRLPLDLDEIASRWSKPSDIDDIMRVFRDDIYEAQEAFVETHIESDRFLDQVHCGDPAAENEAAQLVNYFLETEQFRLTLAGELNIVLGRKGSGKTAIFLQARNKTRADRSNIVVDLQPEGYQLIKLKEFVIEKLSHGARKEFVASFWEYIIWLEIAYKLLEKDEQRVRYDSRLMPSYDRLNDAYKQRVEGSGDFAERLVRLTERIVSRYESHGAGADSKLSSSKILEIVYGSEIGSMRNEVLEYLKRKGVVFFLFDNLDRFWTAPSFTEADASIIIGLVESLTDIQRRFRQADIDFYWAIFLRSDVFEFVVKGMADYGKLSLSSIEWNDRELLLSMFKNRILAGFKGKISDWNKIWEAVSVQKVGEASTLDFLIESSLMRPRYLIRLFETARRRAITLGKNKIEEADYQVALDELGWQVLEDFDRELVDVVPNVEQLLFDIAQIGTKMSLNDLRETISQKVTEPSMVEIIIDVLIWTGCIGVQKPPAVMYISDCGFKRPYIRSLLEDSDAKIIVFHPTLAAIISSPK